MCAMARVSESMDRLSALLESLLGRAKRVRRPGRGAMSGSIRTVRRGIAARRAAPSIRSLSPPPRGGSERTMRRIRPEEIGSAWAQCAWCGCRITSCLAQGSGPIWRCQFRGCNTVVCDTSHRHFGGKCPGPCGAARL
jgi:hypothetical protein